MKLTIGKRVKELRVKNKMTQEQLAEAVDACVGYISKIENNRVNNISLSLACELASVLNVSLGYLVGESTENEMMDEEMLTSSAPKSSIVTTRRSFSILNLPISILLLFLMQSIDVYFYYQTATYTACISF